MYKKILLKLSGESLKGNTSYGIDPITIKKIALEIKEISDLGVQIAIIVGAGNLWRGRIGEELGMDRSQADYMGMLGTIMNSLALQDALEKTQTITRVMTAFPVTTVAEPYIRRKAIRHLEKGRVVILAAGAGSPYFSTDTAAALRAAELHVNVILMAKNNIEGVYNKDPKKHDDAVLLKKIKHEQILSQRLAVMDITAAASCLDNNIDILVFNMLEPGNIKKAVLQKTIGTIISSKGE
ncbi:UMP kinase [Candidatus Phytoplasma solani]|uniref:Uridylate kinase n=1 Tax=Candidatus Phytoplasma solani TaxID=69896 RepID=A0A421NXK1_9MOLU|nr:UMP kinase [Candidatus Phytoplasma solani]RMI88757.1 uridylate kinase [Candidatus Phytoplasma solani]CCP88428.1 Uridylate kinase [Candidatus Phytoplasma solani]